MRILSIILILLTAGNSVASEPLPAVSLPANIPYVPSEPGAFITAPRAVFIRTAFEREHQRAELCLTELKSTPSPYGTAIVGIVIAFTIGLAVGVVIKK